MTLARGLLIVGHFSRPTSNHGVMRHAPVVGHHVSCSSSVVPRPSSNKKKGWLQYAGHPFFLLFLDYLAATALRPARRNIQPPSTIRKDAAPSHIGRLNGPPPVTGLTLGGEPSAVGALPPPVVVSTMPPPPFLLEGGNTCAGGGAAVGAGVGFVGAGVGFCTVGTGVGFCAAAVGLTSELPWLVRVVAVGTGAAWDGTPVGMRVTPLGTATGTWNVV